MTAGLRVATLPIAKDGTTSGAIDCRYERLVGLRMPTGWDAADITFLTSTDGTTYQALTDGAGNTVTLTVAASKDVGFTAAVQEQLRSALYAKLVTSAAQTTAARTLYVLLEPRPRGK